MEPRKVRAVAGMAILAVAAAACGSAENATTSSVQALPSPTRAPTPAATAGESATTGVPESGSPSTASPRPSPVVLAVGDLATCEATTDDMTAALVAGLEGTVLTLGDHAYRDGTAREFAECYDPTWGRVRDRTRPVLGNHDYHTDLAAPYFDYFGAAAGTRGEGWYSFDLGDWHLVALNSNCELVGCSADSPQGRWLAADLAAQPARCTLAYMHHPRWSSAPDGNQAKVAQLWNILVEGDVDVVLAGHGHMYERLAPVDATGHIDPEDGVRHFMVGTGGATLYGFGDINPASEVRSNESFGVLRMVLGEDGYEWEFIPTDAGGFTDSGSGTCR